MKWSKVTSRERKNPHNKHKSHLLPHPKLLRIAFLKLSRFIYSYLLGNDRVAAVANWSNACIDSNADFDLDTV